jgi:prepilin-type processing-associated H-X9-DG protein
MYGADHDERLPPATQARDRRTITLPSLLHPYSKHHYLWQCPTLARQGDHVFTYDGSANDTTVSYGFNRSALNVNGRGIRTAQARDPAFTVAFVDSLFYLAAPTAIASELGSAAPSAQHDAFVTVAWLDGHVSSQRLGKLETLIGVEGGRLTGKGIDRYRYWNLR